MAIANSDGSIVLSLKIVTDGVDKVIKSVKNKFASLKEEKSSIIAITEAIKLQRAELKRLNDEYTQRIVSGQAGTGKELKKQIAEETAYLKELENVATSLGARATKSFSAMAASAKKFGKRIAGIIKSALIFSVIYRVMQSVVKLFKNILMSDEEFRQDWEELKAAFYTAAYPIINLIVPAIKWIVQQVRDWAVSIGKVAAALQGMSYSELVDQAKASKEAADNYEKMEKDSKKTADNVKKQLASFDDIQILSSGNEEEQGAGLAGFEGLKEYDTSGEKSVLDDLMTAIGGALAAVGLILLFKGQIGWGIGFLVAGAAFWAIGEIWGEDYDPNNVSQTINNIMQTLGVSLAAIGIILLTNGIYGWGVGFLIGGAAFWAISEVWGEEDDLSNASVVVENIMQTIGVSLAAVGLILLTKGIFTWGIGFIVAGAAIWAITEFATGEFSEEPIVNTLIKIMGIAGTALAALGIILLVFGQIIWGVTMLAVGAVMLVTALALNNEAIVEAIRGPLGVIMAIVGAALLVLGIILVCTGVGIPLGIALIAAGAASLVTVVALNWDAIVDWVKGAWEAVKGFWNRYIAPIFTAKFWLDLAKTCGNGLIAGFEGAINGLIWLFESLINFVVDGLNLFLGGISTVTGAVGDLIGVNLRIPEIPKASLGRVSIPRLAQGAVIPPNKEFLAVLGDQKHGTNIEAPLQTIVDAFNIALSQNGGNFGGGNTEVVLEIDGREFGRAVVEQGNRENRRIGTRLVIA